MQETILKYRKAILITGGVISFLVILFFLLFGHLTLNVSPKDASFKLDGKAYTSPSRLFIGTHTLVIEKKGYQKINQELKIKPGTNSFSFNLLTNKEVLIKKLPFMNEKFSVSYLKEYDTFSVMIFSLDKEPIKKEVTDWFKNQGVDSNSVKIIWDSPAIFRNTQGP